MAKSGLSVCNKHGCNKLTNSKYCDEHKILKHNFDSNRKSSSKRGYNGHWRKARESYLLSHPFCVKCLRRGIYEKSTVVDHIIPHKGNKILFWDKSNWQALCKSCHDRKTATTDGGFGNVCK